MNKKKMQWGLIGASNIASAHMIGAIRATGGEAASVMSEDAARAKKYALENHIASGVCDLDELLSDARIDAVYISTTNEKHFAQAMAAIDAGKHVLCEKPLAMTTADAAIMVRAADKKNLVFATNHHLRNAGSHIAIKELIQSGCIGRVLSVRVLHAAALPPHLQGWRINDASAGGGVIPDIVVHDADTVRFHLAEDPAEVVAIAAEPRLGQGVEDSVMSVWSMPSGVTVFTHESFIHKFCTTGIEIYGESGSIIARDVMTQRPVGKIKLITDDGETPVEFSRHNLYERALTAFIEAVNGNGRPAADGVDGVKSLAVAEAVAASAKTGARTMVDYCGF